MLVATPLAEDAVHVRVHHYVAAVETELPEEALNPMAGLADEGPADDRLVLRWVLSDQEQPRSAVQPPAVEDRAPFEAEVLRGIGARARDVLAQSSEGLLRVADVEGAHGRADSAGWSTRLEERSSETDETGADEREQNPLRRHLDELGDRAHKLLPRLRIDGQHAGLGFGRMTEHLARRSCQAQNDEPR